MQDQFGIIKEPVEIKLSPNAININANSLIVCMIEIYQSNHAINIWIHLYLSVIHEHIVLLPACCMIYETLMYH